MSVNRPVFIASCGAACAFSLVAAHAQEANWPSRPLKMVVGFPPAEVARRLARQPVARRPIHPIATSMTADIYDAIRTPQRNEAPHPAGLQRKIAHV